MGEGGRQRWSFFSFFLSMNVVASSSNGLFEILFPTTPSIQIPCPDVFQYIVPAALYCNICRMPELSGEIADIDITFQTAEIATHEYYFPLLQKLQRTRFFRFFKVSMDSECAFWHGDESMCTMKDCSVETCDEKEVPPLWLKEENATGAKAAKKCVSPPSPDSPDLEDEKVERASSSDVSSWAEGGDDTDVWIEQSEGSSVYVDLLENPERFTGYTGDHPHRIWQAIYEENCFDHAANPSSVDDGQCLEKRIFYRLISGMQSSITTHIAKGYFYGRNYGEDGYWAPNTELFVERVGRFPERLQNLYFTYLFVMRAVAKAGPEIDAAFSRAPHEAHLTSFSTGHTADDAATRALVRALVYPDHPLIESSVTREAQVCQRGFDETRLFDAAASFFHQETISHDPAATHPAPGSFAAVVGAQAGPDLASVSSMESASLRAMELRKEFQGRFRNISRIMDCVGCEKCRLWGKLQVLGIGTALKILMSQDDLAQSPATHEHGYSLQRNEVIALVNTLGQLSTSVQSVRDWRRREVLAALTTLAMRVALLSAGLWFLRLLLFRRRKATAPVPKPAAAATTAPEVASAAAEATKAPPEE